MQLTNEMKEAISLIDSGERVIYITGKAGTGKTTFLKYLIRNSKKRIVVAAPTGVAAVNAGGMTLHSLFSIPFGVCANNMKNFKRMSRQREQVIKNIDTLVIDEVSMVRADVMDFVDARFRAVRSSSAPFGGVQVVMFGDLYQLPPVVKKEEGEILKQFYSAPYFYYANVFNRQSFKVVELTHVFRQTDAYFVNLLNDIRNYHISIEDSEKLRDICNVAECNNFENDRIHICSLRREVQEINEEQLGEPSHVFSAILSGDFQLSSAPCDIDLKLRVGARVMMLKNDTDGMKYYNGSLGTVRDISEKAISVALDNGFTVEVDKYSWKSYEYAVEGDKVTAKETGSCEQFPLALAWAITIHKSQGLTFDKVAIHASHVFATGQIYVALSRCTSLDGIVTDTFVSRRHILPNRELTAFENAYKDNGYVFDSRTRELMCV